MARSPAIAERGLGKIHGCPLELDPAQTRQVQQLVDQRAHALGGGTDAPQRIPRRLAEFAGAVDLERLAEPVDGTQRRAKVVRHGVAEGLEFAIRTLQLGGPLAEFDVAPA